MIGLYIILGLVCLYIVFGIIIALMFHKKMFNKRWEPDGITKYYLAQDFGLNMESVAFKRKNVTLRGYIYSYNFEKYKGKFIIENDKLIGTNKLTEKGIKWSKDLSVVASDKATFDSQEWDKTATSEDCFLLGGNNNYWIYARKIIRSNKSNNIN